MTRLLVVGDASIDVAFNDGSSGRVDLSTLLQGPMFQELTESSAFAAACLDPVTGTITWPNGADLAPEAIDDLLMCKTVSVSTR